MHGLYLLKYPKSQNVEVLENYGSYNLRSAEEWMVGTHGVEPYELVPGVRLQPAPRRPLQHLGPHGVVEADAGGEGKSPLPHPTEG